MRSTMLFCILAVAALGMALAVPAPAVIDQALHPYYKIQKSLASDSLTGVAASALEIAKVSRMGVAAQRSGKAELAALAETAAKFNSGSLKTARSSFGDLSDRMIAFVKASKSPRNPPYQYYCSMVKKNWLQSEKGIRNPYYGASMLTCGELVP